MTRMRLWHSTKTGIFEEVKNESPNSHTAGITVHPTVDMAVHVQIIFQHPFAAGQCVIFELPYTGTAR